MTQTAIWEPPSLCGCQLLISADFHERIPNDRIVHRHPIPFTITDLQILNVCDGHKPMTLSMPDTSAFFDTIEPNSYVGVLASKYAAVRPSVKQNRGYLSYPIDNPTDAQCLYTFLCQYGGQKHSYPCGCQSYQFVDENKNISYVDHPHHTKKCQWHTDDTPDMRQAAVDFSEIQAQAATAQASLKAE